MEKFNLYKDIQMRTGGEIYVGIVGPVRSGKSTFARKFVEHLVLPELETNARNQARDEMPASASGKTVTTVEPKFIPRTAAAIEIGDGTTMKLRLVDCVGFLVPGAEGTSNEGTARMVKTPWSEDPIPFTEAAKTGTQKVIHDHATVGIIVTTDGSFGELPRSSFLEAEKEAIQQMKQLGKPFIVVVNSAKPYSETAKLTADHIQETYKVTCMILNCEQIERAELYHVFEQFLLEFPLTRVVFQIPKWAETLAGSHWLKKELFQEVKNYMRGLKTVRDISISNYEMKNSYVKKTKVEEVCMANGEAEVSVTLQDTLYYEILSEMTGTPIKNEYQLIALVREMSSLKSEYEAVSAAVSAVRQTGYGMITPEKEEIQMEEPVVIRQGNKYGVRIRAVAPSIHLIRAEIETEIAPIVGNEEQAKDLIAYVKANQDTQSGAWSTLIFGKSIEQMVEEGIKNKLALVSDESRQKLQDTMRCIVNDSKGRLICIII